MATDQEKAVIVGGAAVGAGALLLGRKAAGSTPPPPPSGEDPALALLRQIIAGIQASNVKLDDLKKSVDLIAGFYRNSATIQIAGDVCPAINQPYNLPDMQVPDGMELMVMAWPLNAVGSLIYVSYSASGATNINQGWPLVPGAVYPMRVQNAKEVYVATNVPTSRWVMTAETIRR